MSVFVVSAFVKMRSAFGDTRELARKLSALESELQSRLVPMKPQLWKSCNALWKSSIRPRRRQNRHHSRSAFTSKKKPFRIASRKKQE